VTQKMICGPSLCTGSTFFWENANGPPTSGNLCIQGSSQLIQVRKNGNVYRLSINIFAMTQNGNAGGMEVSTLSSYIVCHVILMIVLVSTALTFDCCACFVRRFPPPLRITKDELLMARRFLTLIQRSKLKHGPNLPPLVGESSPRSMRPCVLRLRVIQQQLMIAVTR
jgi:hypothetical protein